MPASHFDVNSMTGRPKFIVRHSTSKEYDVIAEMCRGNITFVNGLLQFCGTGRSGSCSILWFVVMYNCTYV
jgi:hypothetical protein